MGIGLSDLAAGASGRVVELLANGPMRQRLYDLGIVPGTTVERLMSSPAGDPICYRVRGAMIALRAQDAAGIRVLV